MYVNKIVPILLAGFLFSGCYEKQIEANALPEERIPLNLSEPSQLNLKPVTFYVLTEKNKDAVFKQLEAQNKDKVLIGLSDDDYQKISENLILIQNYIVQQRFIIKSYKDYYETKSTTSSPTESISDKN